MTEKRKLARQPKTFMAKKHHLPPKNWFILDATGKTLGRFASEVAKVLRGKHSPTFTPHVDTGDGVIVVNAKKIVVTGAKEAQKVYQRYSGYQSGLKETSYRVMQAKNPAYIIEHAVKGMLPKTKQARAQMKRLRIFSEGKHSHMAQKPQSVTI